MQHALRQRYTDLEWGDLDTVAHFGYDICQPKHDGQWCCVAAAGKCVTVTSRYGQLLAQFDTRKTLLDACLIGEYLSTKRPVGYSGAAGTGCRVVVWDCLSLRRLSLKDETYETRLRTADFAVIELGLPWLRLIQPATFDQSCTGEGYIFRRSTDTFAGEIARMKRPDYRPFA